MRKSVLIALSITIFGCNNYQRDSVKLTDELITSPLTNSEERQLAIEKMFQSYIKEFPNAENVEVSDLDKYSSIVFVDVREESETEVSMIPGAITKAEFEEHKNSYFGKYLVIYCTIGFRSGIYAEQLSADGLKALNLKGGVLAWSHAKKLFESMGSKTKRVHVYGRQWDLAESSYKSVY